MKKGVNIVVLGSAGRMGAEVLAAVKNHKHAHVLATVSKPGALERIKLSAHDRPVVMIDFSSPSGFVEGLRFCRKNEIGFVSGTTGLSAANMRALRAASKKIAVFWSPNMSFGINLIAELLKHQAFGNYDLQVEEFHHRNKKDAPSGTARMLQNILCAATKKNIPKPLSGRGGGIFGIHKIWAMGDEEVLTIEHTALNRRVFASGAVRAAIWISDKSHGLYDFGDLLK